MDEQVLVAFSTFPEVETARRVVTELVDLNLAACGNIFPAIHSIYRWQGKVESSDEALVVFKLTSGIYDEFEAKLRSLHPYDVPEIVAWKIERGLPEYVRWVIENCD